MNPVDGKYKEIRKKCKLEIIEIGAVMLDENMVEINSYKTYVKPRYSTEIFKKYENLTGITTNMVVGAPGFERAFQDFCKWCEKSGEEYKDSDYTRLPDFDEREKIQKKKLNLPLFPTTTIGSFPQTQDVRQNRQKLRKGLISPEEYTEFNKKKIAECIKLQEEIGLDVLVHGEYERNDMVEYFGENLSGYVFTEKA